MDAQGRIIEMAYRIDHRHPDGSWGEMIGDRTHNDPGDHDPERKWSAHRIFRCTSCDASVTIVSDDGVPIPEH